MLGSADFGAWVSHLRSFIPEHGIGPGPEKKRIYIASEGSNEFEPVDLSHLVTTSKTIGDLIKSVTAKVEQMQKDKLDQPSVMSSMFSSKSESKTVVIYCIANR